MKVSIITICLNSEKTIERAIKSVASQTYKDIEYIVIDGGSVDGTINILEAHKSSIDIIISEKDGGIYDAMNKGLTASTGSIVSILNSDDHFYSDKVVDLVANEFKEDDLLKLVSGQMIKRNKDLKFDILEKCKNTKYALFMSPFNHPTCFFKSEVYVDLGGFNIKYKTAADYDFLLRFLKSGMRYKCLSELLVVFSMHGVTSKTIFSPMFDLYQIHISNGCKKHLSILSLAYRFFRQLLSSVVKKIAKTFDINY
jgi:glycosyltransferase involved in cell wall biosynthesis